jgi:hypothetical protein
MAAAQVPVLCGLPAGKGGIQWHSPRWRLDLELAENGGAVPFSR